MKKIIAGLLSVLLSASVLADPPRGALTYAGVNPDGIHATLSGWACDPSRPDAVVTVHFYLNDPRGQEWERIYAGGAFADRYDPSHQADCGGRTAVRWSKDDVWIPEFAKMDGEHIIFVEAIGEKGLTYPLANAPLGYIITSTRAK